MNQSKDSLHALRLEPLLKLISTTSSPEFDPKERRICHWITADSAIKRLIRRDLIDVATLVRDHCVERFAFHLTPMATDIDAEVRYPSGELRRKHPSDIDPRLCAALQSEYRAEITRDVAQADRYLRALQQLVHMAPEQLINVQRGGIGLRVRTDTPRIDSALLSALDIAMRQCGMYVVTLRISISEHGQRTQEHCLPPKVIPRRQPLRLLALSELNAFLSRQHSSGIFTKGVRNEKATEVQGG